MLALYLVEVGLDEQQVGLLFTFTLAGDAVVTLWLTTSADAFGRRRILLAGALLMMASGVAFIVTDSFAALLVAGLAVVLVSTLSRQPAHILEATRLKGLKPHLEVYRQSGSRAEALAAGGTVHPGDVLQIGYIAAAQPYGLILSIDGRGTVTLHFPASASAPSRLAGDGPVLLDYAYKLDDAPQFERFFLVTAQRAIPVEAVLQAARELAAQPERARTASLALPRGLEQWSLLLIKK